MKFASNLTLYAILSLSQRAASFIMFPLLTRAVTPVDYGFLVISNNILTISSGIFLLGLDIALITKVSESRTEEDRSTIVYSLLVCRVLMFSVQAVLIFGIVWLYPGASVLFDLLMISALHAIVSAAVSHFSQTLQATQNHAGRFQIEMVLLLTQFSATIALLYVTNLGVLVVPVAGTVASIVALVFALKTSRIYLRGKFDSYKIKIAVRFSAPLVASSLAFTFITSGVPIIIGSKIGPEASAIYGAALSIAGLVSISSFVFGQFWLPTVHRIYESQKARVVFREVQKLYATMQLVQALILALTASLIIGVLAPADYYEAYKYVPIILLFFMLQEIIGLFSVGLGIASRYLDRAKSGIFAAVVFLIVVYPLVHAFSIFGGCCALVISQAAFSIMCMVRSQRYYHVRYDWKYVGGIFFIYCAAILLFRYFDLDHASISVKVYICAVILLSALGYCLLKWRRIDFVISIFSDPASIEIPLDPLVEK